MKSNILVVDDEPVARQSMTDILRLEGYTVNSVPNGQAAVEYVRTHPVELMIVDLRMPGMDGLKWFRWSTRSHLRPRSSC
jgi:CheY-like chemotaxis protein